MTHRILCRVLVMMSMCFRIVTSATLSTVGLTPQVINETEKTNNSFNLIRNKRVRKFGFHVQIICGIDSFEDDYYGCVEATELNVNEEAARTGNNTPEDDGSTTDVTEKTTATTATTTTVMTKRSKRTTSEKPMKYSSPRFSKMSSMDAQDDFAILLGQISQSHSVTSAHKHTTTKKSTKMMKPTTKQYYWIYNTRIPTYYHSSKKTTAHLSKSTPTYQKMRESRTIATTSEITKSTASSTTSTTTKKPTEVTMKTTGTPRCFEKTISIGAKGEFAGTSSTDIIWVSNTQPAVYIQKLGKSIARVRAIDFHLLPSQSSTPLMKSPGVL